MTASTTLVKAKKILIKAGAIAVWLLIWQLVSVIIGSGFLFPSPIKVIERFCELAQTGDFWIDCGMTLLRIIAGCLAGVVIGTLLGFATAFSKLLYELFSPLLTIVKTTPVASFIILLLLWLTRSGVTITISALLVIPIMWSNVCTGIKSTDNQLLEMADIYKLSKGDRLKYIYIPGVKPAFASGCTTAIGFAWKSGISAEVIALPQNAMGTAVYHAKINLEYTDLFAWTLAVIILSLIIEKLLVFLLDRFVFGRKKNEH